MRVLHEGILALGLATVGLAGCRPPPAPPPPPAQTDPLPRQARTVHGEVFWAVYLAVGPQPSPQLEAAKARGRRIGYRLGHSDPGCDTAVDKELSLNEGNDDVYVVGAYFATEADARRFAAAIGPPAPLWIGRVKTYCLDGVE